MNSAPSLSKQIDLAESAYESGDFKQAVSVLEEVLASNGGKPVWSYVRLIKYLTAAGAHHEEIERAYLAAIKVNPMRRDLVVQLGGLLTRHIDKDQAIDRLVAYQCDQDEPIASLLLEIGKARGCAYLKKDLKRFVSLFLNDPRIGIIKDGWQALAQAQRLATDDVDFLLAISNTFIDLYFYLISEDILYRKFNPMESEPLSNDTDNLSLSFIMRNLFENDSITQNKNESLYKHQDEIVLKGNIAINNPDQTTVNVSDSFMYYDRIIYTFFDKELYYIISGSASGGLLGIYAPASKTIVYCSASLPAGLTRASFAAVQTVMLKRYVEAAKKAETWPPTSSSARRRVIACVGGIENFAHQLWNSFSGIERHLDLEARYDEIRFFGSEFYGPVESVFPELAGINIQRVRGRGIGGTAPFDPSEILVNVGGGFIERRLIRRMIDHAHQDRWIGPRAKAILGQAAAATPVIWIAVRTGDKSWVDQEAGIVSLIRRVAKAHPKALFLLDGFSFPSGIDHISQAWTKYRAEVDAIITRIMAQCAAESAILSISGLTLNEAITIGRAVDLYVTPLGTTQHKIGWFSDAKGIIYAGNRWKAFREGELPGSKELYSDIKPIYIFGTDEVGSAKLRGFDDKRTNVNNTNIDTEEIISAVMYFI